MSNPLISSVPTPLELQSFKIIAEVAASNPHWRKVGGNGDTQTIVATILSVMLLARELGISPIQAISGGINNIQGKFEISARLMNQLIRKHGHQLKIKSSTNEICIIWSKRKDTGEEHEERYHIDEANRSGLLKDGSAWKKVPSDMLFARCISRMARRLYADCIGGCYVEGELKETIQGKPVAADDIKDVGELKGEFEVKPEEPIVLALPDHISQKDCDAFVKEICEKSKEGKMTAESVKKAASSRLPEFVKALEEWKKKNTLLESLSDPQQEMAEGFA